METNTKDAGLDVISVKRNPYLEEYGMERGKRNRGRNDGPGRTGYQAGRIPGQGMPLNQRRARAVKRRERLQIQCAAISLGILALMVLGVSLLAKGHHAAAASGSGSKSVMGSGVGNTGTAGNAAGDGSTAGSMGTGVPQGTSGAMVQGIPAEVFARHPEWEENFLTPNEYSRPGDELKEVKNIFVHYTANPGTSAAQNRSYFERQKDEHKASVSSHFIIGYDGEIIQCVPLTEIAYAVQTRNFDSVSIECCYKAKDGSFTKETYHSLIALLAWLTDVYDLDTEEILRHYDCGGKKCPLYYTEHADKWTQLKEDVKQMKENTGVKL